MDEEPRGNRWLFAAGVALVVGAGVLGFLLSRRECDCEPEEGDGAALSAPETARRRVLHREIVARVRNGSDTPTAPVVDPLSWDAHASGAWGAALGERKLADFGQFEREFEPDDAELGGEG